MSNTAAAALSAVIAATSLASVIAPATAAANPPAAASLPSATEGFGFLDGEWRVSHRRLQEPLSGSSTWAESEGRATFRSLLDGLGSIEEMRDAQGAPFGGALRTFDRNTRLWSDYWVSARDGILQPAMVGRFDGDVGTFTAPDSFRGQPILARGIWRRVTADVVTWEQAFSTDGGKAWETNWTMRFERIAAR